MWSCRLSCFRSCPPSFSFCLVWSAWIGLWACPTLVWGACGFANFLSINATVNETVMVKCGSNCTPIRILHVIEGSETVQVNPHTEYSVINESHPYITIAAIHLDLTYNDTYLVCIAVNEPSQPSTDNARILLQDFLQPVENLKVTFNATHILFKWQGPPVLPGIELKYKIHLFHEGIIVFNDTITQTYSVVPFSCPCQPSYFGVTPVAGLLVGEERSLSPSCSDDDPKVSIDNEGFRKHSVGNRKVRIAFQIQIYNSWCIPSIAVMTAFCQHTDTTVTHTFRHFKSEDSIIKLLSPISASLPPQDFCKVSLSLNFSDGYTSPPHKPFNISLFDTQFITVELMKNSPTLCVTCHFAPWARGVESCVIQIGIRTLSYNDSEVANKNRAGVGQECFPGLPTDGAYTVYIVVYDDDERHIAAVYNHTLINFTSSHPPTINPANDDDNNTLWKIIVPTITLIMVTVLMALCLIYYFYCYKVDKNQTGALTSYCSSQTKPPKEQKMERTTSTDGDDFSYDKSHEAKSSTEKSEPVITSSLPAGEHSSNTDTHGDYKYGTQVSVYYSANNSECSNDDHNLIPDSAKVATT